jgi:hypothetical protein
MRQVQNSYSNRHEQREEEAMTPQFLEGVPHGLPEGRTFPFSGWGWRQGETERMVKQQALQPIRYRSVHGPIRTPAAAPCMTTQECLKMAWWQQP